MYFSKDQTGDRNLSGLVRSIKRIAIGFLIGLVALTMCAIGKAQTSTWTNTTNTNAWWHNGINWSTPNRPTSTGTALFNASSVYQVWWNGTTQGLSPSVGQIDVTDGVVTFESQTASIYDMQINSTSSSSVHVTGSSTRLNTSGVNLTVNGGVQIDGTNTLEVSGYSFPGTTLTVNGSGVTNDGTFKLEENSTGILSSLTTSGYTRVDYNSSLTVNGVLRMGTVSQATMQVVAGSQLMTQSQSFIGDQAIGGIYIHDSDWTSSQFIFVGQNNSGTIDASGGSQINNAQSLIIANNVGSIGNVDVEGAGTEFNNTGSVYVGQNGSATLDVTMGGKLTSGFGYIAASGGTGVATVEDANSRWENSGAFAVGGTIAAAGGTGTLNIDNGGTVTVGGTTKIWSGSSVNINGGTFEFGQMTYDEFAGMNVSAGTLAGTIQNFGYHNAATLAHFNDTSIDVTGIDIENSGTLYGNYDFSGRLANMTFGEIETVAGERMRFMGGGNSNDGEINNFGGTLRFDQDATNQTNGFITGRGQFIANGGWTNQGVMAFSGGPSDVLGDVDNQTGGRIVTAGGSTTTFYDDVVHNGTEIHTAAGSNTVFFGSQSGAGAFTGTGTVFYQGDLRPGNSPAVVTHEGSLVLGSTVSTFIELGGELEGEFDQFQIDGDLDLDGSLTVDTIDGFQLSANDSFVIAKVDGNLNGAFNNFGEGDIVGNFGGHDLFISYAGGDGNDVTLFTAVPEPGSSSLFAVAGLLAVFRRRPRNKKFNRKTSIINDEE